MSMRATDPWGEEDEMREDFSMLLAHLRAYSIPMDPSVRRPSVHIFKRLLL